MRVFVTGGAGFIGSSLSRRLVGAGHRVTVFDNLSNSTAASVSGMEPDRLRLVVGDVLDADALASESAGHDVMVHLAAQISVQRSVTNPGETMRINVDGSKNVVAACKKNGIGGMVAASSAAVFGDTLARDAMFDEESPCSPVSPYGQSKLEMERILAGSGLDSTVLRFFNIYGPGQNDEYAGVISKFAGAIKGGTDVVIHGDGSQTRDFVAIDDVVTAVELAISRSAGGRGGTYNIGSGTTISVKTLASMMLEVAGSNCRIIHAGRREGDVMFSATVVKKALDELGFKSRMQLPDGIRRYWDSF